MPDRIWNAAEYTRLSRDDGDKAESNSITSQKEIIRDYVRRHPEFVIVKEYADATVIIGLKQNPTHGRRFSPIFFA